MKGALAICAAVVLLDAAPAAAEVCTTPEGWMVLKSEQASTYQAALSLGPTVPQVGTPFDVALKVCSPAGAPVERLSVDATMPAHKHGMNYAPQLTKTAEDAYMAAGFLFHMPGVWRVTVSVYGAGAPSHLSTEITVP